MREAFKRFVQAYPTQPTRNDGTFKASKLKAIVETDLVRSVSDALGADSKRYMVRASIGKGDWTHTPWLVVLDPAVTTSVESGYYVVYLLSRGCERLYLSLAQGCTTLKQAVGTQRAKEELARRARIMNERTSGISDRLEPIQMDLSVDASVWRGKLYERGCIVGKAYDARDLPDTEAMRLDLTEALKNTTTFVKKVAGPLSIASSKKPKEMRYPTLVWNRAKHTASIGQ